MPRRAGQRRCRPGPGPPRTDRTESPKLSSPRPRSPRPHHRLHPPNALQPLPRPRPRPRHFRRLQPQRPPPRRRPPPTAAVRPSHAAGCAGRVDQLDLAAPPRRRRRRQPWTRPAQRWAPSRLGRPCRGHARLLAVPSPGTSGRQGTRSTGSRPPGAQERAEPEATRRNSGGDGLGSSTVRHGRRRTPRTDKLGHRPCWAALAQSSAR